MPGILVNKTDIVPDLKGYICLVGDKDVISIYWLIINFKSFKGIEKAAIIETLPRGRLGP